MFWSYELPLWEESVNPYGKVIAGFGLLHKWKEGMSRKKYGKILHDWKVLKKRHLQGGKIRKIFGNSIV